MQIPTNLGGSPSESIHSTGALFISGSDIESEFVSTPRLANSPVTTLTAISQSPVKLGGIVPSIAQVIPSSLNTAQLKKVDEFVGQLFQHGAGHFVGHPIYLREGLTHQILKQCNQASDECVLAMVDLILERFAQLPKAGHLFSQEFLELVGAGPLDSLIQDYAQLVGEYSQYQIELSTLYSMMLNILKSRCSTDEQVKTLNSVMRNLEARNSLQRLNNLLIGLRESRSNSSSRPDPAKLFSANTLIENNEHHLRQLCEQVVKIASLLMLSHIDLATALELELHNHLQVFDQEHQQREGSLQLAALAARIEKTDTLAPLMALAVEIAEDPLLNQKQEPGQEITIACIQGSEAQIITRALENDPVSPLRIVYRGQNGIDEGGLLCQALASAYSQLCHSKDEQKLFTGQAGQYRFLDDLPSAHEYAHDLQARKLGVILGQMHNSQLVAERLLSPEAIDNIAHAVQVLQKPSFLCMDALQPRLLLKQWCGGKNPQEQLQLLGELNPSYASNAMLEALQTYDDQEIQQLILDQTGLYCLAIGLLQALNDEDQFINDPASVASLFESEQFMPHFLQNLGIGYESGLDPEKTSPLLHFVMGQVSKLNEAELRQLCFGMTGSRALPSGDETLLIDVAQGSFDELAIDLRAKLAISNPDQYPKESPLEAFYTFASFSTCAKVLELNHHLLQEIFADTVHGPERFKQSLLASCGETFNMG